MKVLVPDTYKGALPVIEGVEIVVVPTRDGARHLRGAITSVLAQAYPRVECIVRDGASTDGSLAILESFGDRIRWHSRPDSGPFEAIEAGWAEAAGDAAGARTLVKAARTVELIDFDGSVDPVSLAPVRADLLESVVAVVSAAERGEAGHAIAALSAHRILCGHREGPFGVGHWARASRSWLATQLSDYGYDSRPYVGQPLLIQRNTDLFHNGDTAVVITSDGGGLVAAVDRPEGPFMVAPSLLDDAADLHAMTIHKSQGSQFDAVSVVLPPSGSALLTRELIYTAVTRARGRVRMYGSWERLEEAIATPVRRASGLARH